MRTRAVISTFLLSAIAAVAALAVFFPIERAIVAEILLTRSLGPAYLGHGQPPEEITLCSPMGLAVDQFGRLLVSDRGDGLGRMVWRLEDDGRARVVAGSGPAESAPPGSANDVSFERPDSLAVAPDGGLFVADGYRGFVYRIDTSGMVSAWAGTGESGYAGDGGPALNASLSRPADIVVDEEGGLFIADAGNHTVRYIDASGLIRTVAGKGEPGFSPDGTLATDAYLNSPWGIALDREGRLLISDSENHRVRRLEADGRLMTLAGNGIRGFSGDGGSALGASLDSPQALAADNAGNVIVVDEHNHAVRMIDALGNIETLIGNGSPGRAAPGTAASIAALNDPESILVNDRGELILADGNNSRVLRIDEDGKVWSIVGNGDHQKCRTLRERLKGLVGAS